MKINNSKHVGVVFCNVWEFIYMYMRMFPSLCFGADGVIVKGYKRLLGFYNNFFYQFW
jgi:hypothetical protein